MTEVVVTRKGQTTIPVDLRRKYKIQVGSRLEAIDTGSGILRKDGRQTARLRAGLMSKDFKVIQVDEHLAVASAEMRQEYRIPMADSIIAATASALRAVCVTDDPHISKIREVKTRWIL